MAERGGFEPPRRYYRPTGIRSQTLQPLGYLSTAGFIVSQLTLLFQSKNQRESIWDGVFVITVIRIVF